MDGKQYLKAYLAGKTVSGSTILIWQITHASSEILGFQILADIHIWLKKKGFLEANYFFIKIMHGSTDVSRNQIVAIVCLCQQTVVSASTIIEYKILYEQGNLYSGQIFSITYNNKFWYVKQTWLSL